MKIEVTPIDEYGNVTILFDEEPFTMKGESARRLMYAIQWAVREPEPESN